MDEYGCSLMQDVHFLKSIGEPKSNSYGRNNTKSGGNSR